MAQSQKPIPIIEPWTKEFWKGSKEGRLLVQHCNDCQANIFFPKKVCPECWSQNLSWIPASGKGTVYTFSVMLDMVEPKFMGDLPYVLAMVDLPEGIRMTTRIVNCDPETIEIGMPVEVTFEDISPECALPMFQPQDASLRTATEESEDNEAIAASPATLQPEDYHMKLVVKTTRSVRSR